MVALPVYRHRIPLQPHDTGHDPDLLPMLPECRSLLDMEFQPAPCIGKVHAGRSQIDLCIAVFFSLFQILCRLQREQPCHGPAPECAAQFISFFSIGGDDVKITGERDLLLLKRDSTFRRSHHAQKPVEHSSLLYRIQVGARVDHGSILPAAFQQAVDIARRIDPGGQPACFKIFPDFPLCRLHERAPEDTADPRLVFFFADLCQPAELFSDLFRSFCLF